VFFELLNNSESHHKSSAHLCQQELVEQLQLFKNFMFHAVVQQTF